MGAFFDFKGKNGAKSAPAMLPQNAVFLPAFALGKIRKIPQKKAKKRLSCCKI